LGQPLHVLTVAGRHTLAAVNNIQNDPNETRSVYEDPGHAAHIARLTTAMKTWQQKVGETLALNEGSTAPSPA